MSELTFITETPCINLTFISYNSTVIISTTDINDSLSDKMIQLNWFILVSKTSCAELTKSVISPNKYFSIFIKSHREVLSRLYFLNIIKIELNNISWRNTCSSSFTFYWRFTHEEYISFGIKKSNIISRTRDLNDIFNIEFCRLNLIARLFWGFRNAPLSERSLWSLKTPYEYFSFLSQCTHMLVSTTYLNYFFFYLHLSW